MNIQNTQIKDYVCFFTKRTNINYEHTKLGTEKCSGK